MRSEKLTFPGHAGDDLAARLDLPLDEAPVAYALFAHCFTCSKNLRSVGHVSRALAAQGIAVLRFDFTGLGESEGDFAETTFSSNTDDLVAAARFLEMHYEAPALLVGHSLGGAAVIQAASRIPSAKAVATIGAPCDPAHVTHLLEDALDEIAAKGEARVRLAGRPFTIRKQFLDDLEGARMDASVEGLGRPLLLFHSPVDETVGVENAAHLFHAARHPKSFVSLDRADHLLTDETDASYVGDVLAAWARKYLGTPAREETKYADPADNRIYARIGREGYRTEVMANGHALVVDEPREVGGTNAGPSPYDYLVAALGACTAMTLRMYADRKRWPLEGVAVRLLHRKVHARECETCETKDGKIDHIEREIELLGPLDAAQQARLREIARRCPVHRSLEGEVKVEDQAKGEG